MPHRTLHEWGPFVWGLVHTISIIDFDEPSIQKEHVDKAICILKNMHLVIPCPKCAAHYHTHILQELSKINIYQNMELFKLTVAFHNEVNKTLGKDVMEYEAALKKWVNII